MWIENLLKSNKAWVMAVLYLLMVLLAIHNIFTQDDAYISFRYAQNLVQFGNFSWNANDVVKIEGYTNFLWTLLIAGGLKFGLEPALTSSILGICLGLGTLMVTHRLAKYLFPDNLFATITVLMLGTNFTFSAYMTGGLETQLQTFLITCICLFIYKSLNDNPAPRYGYAVLIGLFTALAMLTRLDSCIIAGLLILYYLYKKSTTSPAPATAAVFHVLLIGLPVMLIIGPWLFWKYGYYGGLLPNSFYLKGTSFSLTVFKSGMYFLISFFGSYQLLVFFVIVLIFRKRVLENIFLIPIGIVLVFWFAYIIKVGGDFMEFRFMVPVLPFIMIFVTWCIVQLENKTFQYLLVFLVVGGSISHALIFDGFMGVESMRSLNDNVVNEKSDWKNIGIKLKAMIPPAHDSTDAIIAVTAAGAIPYYSELPTVDMLGVNDKWIAQHGESFDHFRPGHNKWAKMDYYIQTKTNLVIGHPQVREKNWADGKEYLSPDQFENFKIASLMRNQIPASATIVEFPLNYEYNFYALYLRPHPAIDSAVRVNNLKVFPIR